ncbi:hypothetical protein EJ05DRAFT_18111 [Pseudovirgaria hyperparasitica]|uniref:Integral membrane protein n=1 Tax=Pseudovirgaria hyperparasitica TaxID=470096 RepID=A0A6A6WKZ5_9PEZI|nr:uncharacterized protein EJ05DRAFT_18111 [Pseudovirgaria hyperparasitica]KAF2762874.1 hypothetical protein EJ05DRAFT_18111 [Pseudovirgaria hyperparasitica]
MSVFDNPDPFGGSRDSQAHQHDISNVIPTEHSRPTPASEDRMSSRTSNDSRFLMARTTSDREYQDDVEHNSSNVMDKLKTAAGDFQAGVVDTVRSARHRFHLDGVHATGVSRFLNPTNVRMRVRFHDSQHGSREEELMWRARDNRKGRNSIAVPRLSTDHSTDASFIPMQYTPRMTQNIRGIGKIFYKMFFTFPYWDMAYWSGMTYSIGSALFVVDGVLAWGAVAYGEEFVSRSAETYGGPLSFFIGALFYQVGAVAAYLEAVNDGSFHGAAMRRLLEGHEDDDKKMFDEKVRHFFSHLNPAHRHSEEKYTYQLDPEAGWRAKEAPRQLRPAPNYPPGKEPAHRRGGVDHGGEQGQESIYMSWRWWPTWRAVRTHHIYSIGWLATTIQLFGVTMYGVTAIVILPGILDSLAWWQTLGAFWVPQLIAASCFLIASLMFMLETQTAWWRPEPKVLGWWVGFWATVGSVGFELIAVFGIVGHKQSWGKYQSDLATIWGSAAYFICSFLQWYEAMDKNPIEELFNDPGEIESSQIFI